MKSYSYKTLITAAALSGLAGFVDALGFLAAGGFFVSFMSGNSTRLSVGVAQASSQALTAGGLIAAFVFGVIVATIVGRSIGGRRRAVLLALVTALLLLGALLVTLGHPTIALLTIATAMGAENAVFERDGEVHIGLTYMTGTLVKLGQRLAGTLFGDAPFGWLPYLMLWVGLVGGAVLGAMSFTVWELHALWLAVAASAALTIFVFFNDES